MQLRKGLPSLFGVAPLLVGVAALTSCGGSADPSGTTNAAREPAQVDACAVLGKVVVAQAAAVGRSWSWTPAPGGPLRGQSGESQVLACKGFLHASGARADLTASNDSTVSVAIFPRHDANQSCQPSGPVEGLSHLATLEANVKTAVIGCAEEETDVGPERALLGQDGGWVAQMAAETQSTATQGAKFLTSQARQQIVVDWLVASRFNGRDLPAAHG